jgi:manganese efflux pump family protein
LAVIFVSLGLDTLAVAIGLGLTGLPRSRWLRTGITFALFEGLMPILGFLLGHQVTGLLGTAAIYAGAAILILLGLLEIKEAISERGDDDSDEDGDGKSEDDGESDGEGGKPETGAAHERPLWLAGLSVSLDELAIGFSLGVLKAPIGVSLGYISIQAFAFTWIGLSLGQRLGKQLRERAELAAGIILLVLGLALMAEAITGIHVL